MVNTEIKIDNEYSLHTKVVSFIRKYHEEAVMIAGLGEFQTTGPLRCKGYSKGYTPGQPDLIILNPNINYSGMAIEFKTPKGSGKISDAQESFINKLSDLNYCVLVSNDYDEILVELMEYFRTVVTHDDDNCSMKSN